MSVYQIDIVGVYLDGLLTDNNLPIIIKLLPRTKFFRAIRKGLVACLLQSLYGLKQFEKLLIQNVVTFFTCLGFVVFNVDSSILIPYDKDGITMISVYVDDFSFTSTKQRKGLD